MNDRLSTRKSTLLSVISVLALAGGIAPETFAQTSPPCGDAVFNCRNVKVTVQGNQISLDPATVTVTGRQTPAVKIVWYLATPGYKFVDTYDSYLMMAGTPGTRPVSFTAEYFMSNDPRFCHMWMNNQAYICTDWNADAFPWGVEYTLKVQATSGGSSPSPVTGRVVNN